MTVEKVLFLMRPRCDKWILGVCVWVALVAVVPLFVCLDLCLCVWGYVCSTSYSVVLYGLNISYVRLKLLHSI